MAPGTIVWVETRPDIWEKARVEKIEFAVLHVERL